MPERIIEQANLLIHEGRIAYLLESNAHNLPVADSTIDLHGLTIFPGFIDVHIHGAVGVDTMAATAAELDRVSQFLATRGVTGWLPTLVPGPSAAYSQAISAINEAMKDQEQAGRAPRRIEKHPPGTPPSLRSQPEHSQRGARILGVHYEGPFVNATQCGALHSEFFRSFSGTNDLDDLPKLDDQDAKHVITLAPEVDGGVELVRELKRRGWIVSIGHTRASFALLDQALAAGANHMTHFMNAMAPLHHRAPGPVAWGLAHDEVTCDIIADGIHLDPVMLQLLLKLKGAARLSLISDAIAAAGMSDGDYEIWGETITVKNGRTSNERGAIAGAVITMLDAARTMLAVGASEIDVARMAATNPARWLGVDQDCGSIEEGKRADLVALDSDGKVVLTVIGGAVAFDIRDK